MKYFFKYVKSSVVILVKNQPRTSWKNLNDLKKTMNKLKLKLDNKNKHIETLSKKFDKGFVKEFPTKKDIQLYTL